MTSTKRICRTIIISSCLMVLLFNLSSAKTQYRNLKEFLSAGNSADLCYINPTGQAILIKDIQRMPPSPALINRLKKEGTLDAFLKQISASQKVVSSTGLPLNHTSKMMQIQSKGEITISAVTGTQKAIVLFVDFSDKVSKTNTATFNTLLFGSGSSLTNYYKTVSYSKLSVSGQVAGWFRAPQKYTYYCYGKYGTDGTYPHNAQKLVEDAINLANPTVNFSQYDLDGDSVVDALFVVHAGPGAEYTGSVNDIWSHAWVTKLPKLVDGVFAYSYSMEPEYWVSSGDMTIGVYCHELGHVLGLPDFYDTDYTSEGLGDWSLMAGGSWNGNDGDQPAFLDAWSRIYLGWVTPSTLRRDLNTVNIPSAETTAVVYKLWSQGTAVNEYFLVENRQKYSYDKGLPSAGLCIYHVDEGQSTNDNEWYAGYTTSGHYWVALEQADGNYQLEKGTNRGDTGDPYPGTSLKYNFNSTTTPNSKSYSGRNVQVEVNNISSSAMNMTADLKIGISTVPVELSRFDTE